VELLREYIGAMVNLYGMFPKEKLLKVYNEQNSEQVSMDDIEAFMTDKFSMIPGTFAFPYEDYFAHEVIVMYGEFDELLAQKGSKPYYVPKKKELLKYLDQFYFEKTKSYRDLHRFVRRELFPDDAERAQDVSEEAHGLLQMGEELSTVIGRLTQMGVVFDDENQAREVMMLITKLGNDVRLWENNGHTPNEMSRMFGGGDLSSLAEESSEERNDKVIDFVERKKKKIGRNDPCPCGSGKKYKKCCLGKDE